MNNTLMLVAQLVIVALVLGLINALLFGIRYAGIKLEWSTEKRRNVIWRVVSFLVIWLLFVASLAYFDFFDNFSSGIPRIILVLAISLLSVIILSFLPPLAPILKVIPAAWFFYIQGFRIIMELFLWIGYKAGFVPPQMTFEWLNFDIIVGITGPMAGLAFFGKRRYQRFQAIYWNVFGIALLINILWIAILSMPTQFRVFMNDPSSEFVTSIPFIWIPSFIVPFALAMHLLSLRQLIFHYRHPMKKFLDSHRRFS